MGRSLERKSIKEMQIQFYRALVVEVLYVTEAWVVKKKDLLCIK
jgi:hypothetical protein